jgi:GntR family transcriptional regulator
MEFPVALDIQIITGAPAPIYRQIIDQVRLAVATGSIREGDVLPSVRALAGRLLINPNTVARAYGDLVRDGLLESQPGKGMTVARKRRIYTKAECLRRIDPALTAFLNEAIALDLSEQDIEQALKKKLTGLQVLRNTHGDRNHD